jgi:hypothetical protein
MNFKEFTDRIITLLQRKTGDGYTVTATTILKNNDIRLTGIVIMEENDNVSPTIYLEEPYRQYLEGASLQEISEEIMEIYEMHIHNRKLNMDFFKDFSQVEDGIFHKVVNYEKNRKLLNDVPYFRWHDLAVIFYYGMENAAFGRASVMIHNSHLDMWGKSAEEVYRIARRNMKRSMPELLLPMQKMMEELMIKRMNEDELTLYVLTNREKIFGASAMLYSEKLKELADRFGCDLLILPSSVHEVLIVPDDRKREYDYYRWMVKEVNTTQVDPEEILSYNLYRYDRKKEEIEEITV